MPERLARVLTIVLQAACAMPLPMCIRLRTEERIAHALGMAAKGVHRTRGETACVSWVRCDGGQCRDRADEVCNLPLFKQRARRSGPARRNFRGSSKDSVGHVPHMLFGMGEIDDVHGSRKVFGGQVPNPRRAVAHDHHPASLAPARIAAPPGKATSQSRLWPCGGPHRAGSLRQAYPHTPPVPVPSGLTLAPHETPLRLCSRDTRRPCAAALPFPSARCPVACGPTLHPVRYRAAESPSAAAALSVGSALVSPAPARRSLVGLLWPPTLLPPDASRPALAARTCQSAQSGTGSRRLPHT